MFKGEAPKIEYPCPYPIKVIGRDGSDFQSRVLATVKLHAPEVDESKVKSTHSKAGTFTSLTITILATGEDQLKRMHRDLMATGLVSMVI